MSPRSRVTQGNLSRGRKKNRCPRRAEPGPAQRGARPKQGARAQRFLGLSARRARAPPSACFPVLRGLFRQARAGLIAEVDATPATLRLGSTGRRLQRKA